jgi:hypothetical protein
MLERLDTLIAFATVMLGVSLLITILNQMIASMLGHRATYLKDGIIDLLETLDPALAPNVEKIATDVLTHRLASDSVFVRIASAPQRWKLASTIRPDELAKLLTLVSTGKPYAANIQAILSQVNPAVEREATLLAGTMNTLAPHAAATADELIKEFADKTTKAMGRLEAAFNSTMDRVHQRFTLQMRIWTIVFSLAFALIYHLDAIRIYSQISNDPALQASLSKISDGLMAKYTASVMPPSSSATGTNTGAATNTGASTGTATNTEKDPAAIAQAYKDVQSDLANAKLQLLNVPEDWWDWKSLGLNGFLRLLATAGLLSLGAPFWYNSLKGLANLRSQVAVKQDAEAKS